MDRKIKIKGSEYKVAVNFLAFRKFAQKKGLKKLSEVSVVLDSFSKINSEDIEFDLFDDMAMFLLACIEAGEMSSIDISLDELQMQFMSDSDLIKSFFETVNESISGDARPGKSVGTKKKSLPKK